MGRRDLLELLALPALPQLSLAQQGLRAIPAQLELADRLAQRADLRGPREPRDLMEPPDPRERGGLLDRRVVQLDLRAPQGRPEL